MIYPFLLFLLLPRFTTPVVADWPAAFAALDGQRATVFQLRHAEPLPLPQGQSPYHQQGIQRLAGGGWAVSGSDADRGYLYFTDAGGSIHTVYALPDNLQLAPGDRLKYNHPGGFQISGHILAIGLENTDLRRDSYSRVVLLDVTDPQAPKHHAHLDIFRPAEAGRVMTAGAVAIAEWADGYLIIVGNWDSRRLDFYRTSSKDLANPDTRMSACLGSWPAGEDARSYQNINAYGHDPAQLHLIGLYSINRTLDYADLLTLNCSDWNRITLSGSVTKPFTGGLPGPRFVHGAGTWYDDAEQQLWVYSVEAHIHAAQAAGNLWGAKR